MNGTWVRASRHLLAKARSKFVRYRIKEEKRNKQKSLLKKTKNFAESFDKGKTNTYAKGDGVRKSFQNRLSKFKIQINKSNRDLACVLTICNSHQPRQCVQVFVFVLLFRLASLITS